MQEIDLKHLNEAYSIIGEAIGLAMMGKFPMGMDAVEKHMTIKGALRLVGTALKEAYEEQIKALEEEPVAAETKE